MTKKEIIEKYGEEEWKRQLERSKNYYEAHKLERSMYMSKYYQDHIDDIRAKHFEYNRHHNEMFAYVAKGELELVENYELALKDNFCGWVLHHKFGLAMSSKELKDNGKYYGRPANELVFMKVSDHTKLHKMAAKKAKEAAEYMKEHGDELNGVMA